jgi:hypothetical protein
MRTNTVKDYILLDHPISFLCHEKGRKNQLILVILASACGEPRQPSPVIRLHPQLLRVVRERQPLVLGLLGGRLLLVVLSRGI